MRWRDVLFQSKHFNQLSFLLTATVCLHVYTAKYQFQQIKFQASMGTKLNCNFWFLLHK